MGHERCNLADKPGGPEENPLTLEEKQAVADVVKEGVAAGAIGFSTNRFGGHRDTSGVLVPGTLADADEILMIGKAVAEAGGGMFEMAQDFSGYDDIPGDKRTRERAEEHHEREWRWFGYLATEYGLTVNFGHADAMRRRQLDECNARVKAAGGTGRVSSQTFTRPQAVIMVSPHRTISSRSHHASPPPSSSSFVGRAGSRAPILSSKCRSSRTCRSCRARRCTPASPTPPSGTDHDRLLIKMNVRKRRRKAVC